MSECCLICGISKAEVVAVRNREGYTLGCGIESNTEAGFDYEELSPRHKWKPWSDRALAVSGIKGEAFEKYRNARADSLRYAACEDTVRGHNYAEGASEYGLEDGECWDCGKMRTDERS